MIKSVDRLKVKTYVGYSSNIKLRLKKHNSSKGAKSTKGYKWKIIYKKKFNTRSDAMSYEYLLKKDRKKRSIILKRNQ
tara:strand:- start:817 stop:1050 length:234 start_codon:yes stop_codon:yes gene_type:complete